MNFSVCPRISLGREFHVTLSRKPISTEILTDHDVNLTKYHGALQSAVLRGPGGAYGRSLCSAALREKISSTAWRIDHLQSVWILLLSEAVESPQFTITSL